MKELTTIQKAQRYDEILARAEGANLPYYKEDIMSKVKEFVDYLIPELKEKESVDENERMWKLIKKYAHSNISDMVLDYDNITREQLESWLEKESKQKPIIEGTFVNTDEVREDFMQEVYRVLDADPTNDRANQIIDAFDHLPTITIQKPCDNVEPKFHEGEWIIGNKDNTVHQVKAAIKNVSNGKYAYDLIDGGYISTSHESDYHLWTIKDAKDGNVIFNSSTASHETFIFKNIDENGNVECYFAYDSEDGFREGKYHFIGRATNSKPATKEQYDSLMKAMSKAGYTFDFNKKELKKIEQKPLQWNISDYRTWQYIVADVLTKKDGIGQYLDDGFCKNIAKYMQEEWSKKLCLNKHTSWNEEDESMLTRCIGILGKCYMGELPTKVEEELNWLKYLSDRVQLQPKQEWSKEDEDIIKFLISHFCVSHYNRSFQFTTNKLITHDELIEKIRNLRPHWKPSDNQMDALDYYANSICTYSDRQDDLRSLFNDLKKLTK